MLKANLVAKGRSWLQSSDLRTPSLAAEEVALPGALS